MSKQMARKGKPRPVPNKKQAAKGGRKSPTPKAKPK
jgi:hypothetical protein